MIGNYHRSDITSTPIQVVERESLSTKEAIRRLEKQIAKVLLINEAMWEILRDEHGYTDKTLEDKIKEVDLRDGVADGANQPRDVSACTSCGRNSPKRNKNCMYCGHELTNSIFTM